MNELDEIGLLKKKYHEMVEDFYIQKNSNILDPRELGVLIQKRSEVLVDLSLVMTPAELHEFTESTLHKVISTHGKM